MILDFDYPAQLGAGPILNGFHQPEPDAFERLPMNLTAEEIREMVLEVMG